MPKWLLYGLAAAGQFAVAAALFFYGDRVVIPAVLVLAGLTTASSSRHVLGSPCALRT